MVEALRELWEQIESDVQGIEQFGGVLVVDTIIRARARQALETDWHVYNVIWLRDGVVARRRAFVDRALARAAAKSPSH